MEEAKDGKEVEKAATRGTDHESLVERVEAIERMLVALSMEVGVATADVKTLNQAFQALRKTAGAKPESGHPNVYGSSGS